VLGSLEMGGVARHQFQAARRATAAIIGSAKPIAWPVHSRSPAISPANFLDIGAALIAARHYNKGGLRVLNPERAARRRAEGRDS